jgi:DNA-binding transcriptional MerR regulator
MRMRDLETASGVGRETIRYYIREGLLPEPLRTGRNAAVYGDEHVSRLKTIKRLQEERFLPLAVIRTLLDAEDSERWLEPQAFPLLDTLLAARLGPGSERIGYAEVVAQLGLDAHQRAQIERDGVVHADSEGMITARDAAILRLVDELDRIGFASESSDGLMRFYLTFIDWITTQEIGVFFERTVGQVGEAKALDMAERGIAIVNELLSLMRTRALLTKLRERRRVANDNG